MIKYARLPLKIGIEALQAETAALLLTHKGKAHLNVTQYSGNWDVIALRSPDGEVQNIAPELMGKGFFADTPLMLLMPTVQQFVAKFNCEVMAVRLLNLRAGARILPHRDTGLCYEQDEARLHVPIFTNPQVEFFILNERIIMLPGQCWYINANLTHSVFNASETDRVHLVIDCKVNDWLNAVFEQGEITTYEEPLNIGETEKIIAQLRLMGTEVANKLADDLQVKLQAHLAVK